MKPMLLILLLTAACDLTPRLGAEPMVTGLGRTETSVEF